MSNSNEILLLSERRKNPKDMSIMELDNYLKRTQNTEINERSKSKEKLNDDDRNYNSYTKSPLSPDKNKLNTKPSSVNEKTKRIFEDIKKEAHNSKNLKTEVEQLQKITSDQLIIPPTNAINNLIMFRKEENVFNKSLGDIENKLLTFKMEQKELFEDNNNNVNINYNNKNKNNYSKLIEKNYESDYYSGISINREEPNQKNDALTLADLGQIGQIGPNKTTQNFYKNNLNNLYSNQINPSKLTNKYKYIIYYIFRTNYSE